MQEITLSNRNGGQVKRVKYRVKEEVFVAITHMLQSLKISYGFNQGFCYVVDQDSPNEIKNTLRIPDNHVKILLKNEIKNSTDPLLIEFRENLNNSQISKYIDLFVKHLAIIANEIYESGEHASNFKTGKSIGHIDDLAKLDL